MTWILLAALSALFLGIYDVSKKSSLDGNAVLPVLIACSLAGALLIAPAGVVTWVAPERAKALGVFVAPLSGHGHALVLLKAGIVTLSWVLTYFAMKHLPITLASPIRASAPLFVLLGAVLLFRERPTPLQWAGIAAVIACYWAFSLLGRAEGFHFGRNPWIWMLFAGTLVGAGSGLYDKHLLQSARLAPMAVQFWCAIYNVALQALLVAVAWWPRRRAYTPFVWRWSILAVGGLLLISDNLYFRALAVPLALISVVSMIRRSNVVVSFAVGSVAFREQNRRKKAFALAGMLVGLSLLLK